MTIGKRLISIVLVCSMIFSMSATAFASTDKNNNYLPDIYTVDQNGNIHYTEVLEELPDENAHIISDKTKASATMDQYISNIIVSAQNGMTAPTIKYTVKMQIPVGVDCYLGYEFPAGYGKVGKMVAVLRNPGTYTINLGAPNFIGKYNFRGKLTARNYSEYKELKTVTFYPTQSTTTYHEVTATEAQSLFLIASIPALLVEMDLKMKVVKITASVVAGWSTISGVMERNSTPLSFTPKNGNYIQTISTYSSTGLTIKMTTYKSKTDRTVENISTVRYNFR